MPFYEVIFETGRSSVANYEDEAEALSANGAHNERAVKGEVGGPTGHPAERVTRILLYDKHPNDYNVNQQMPADQVTSEINALVKGVAASNDGMVPVAALAVEVQALTHPMVRGKESAHDSNFKLKEKSELKLSWKGSV